MTDRTLYELLMLDPSADADVIATVYRRLAKRYHPDRDPSPGARDRMAELNRAYEVLGDAAARAAYDATLRPSRGSSATSPSTSARAPAPASDPKAEFGEAGPPPYGATTGPKLTFSRYRGWTIAQVARVDHDFLEWLDRSPSGRAYRDELARILRRIRRP